MTDPTPHTASNAAAAASLAQELPPVPAWVPVTRVWSLATNTFTELARSKVFYIVAIFGLIVLGASSLLAQLDPDQVQKVLKDISLGSMSIFTTLLAIAATALLIPKDVEDRTLYTILAKPVTRIEYLLGKLGGVFLLIGALTIIMSVMACGVLALNEWRAVAKIQAEMQNMPPDILQARLDLVRGHTFSSSFFLGIILLFVKSCVLATICLAVSTITTSTIFTILCTSAIYFIGHVQGTAREFWIARDGQSVSLVKKIFLGIVAVLFPDLQLFNLSDEINAGNSLPLHVFYMTCGWGVFFIALYIVIGYVIFSKKEL
jgi:hypothetical protein